MPAPLNTAAIHAEFFSSNSVSVLSTLILPVPEGSFVAFVEKEARVVGEVHFHVEEGIGTPQVSIDLAELAFSLPTHIHHRMGLHNGFGFPTFFMSSGEDNYQIRIIKRAEPGESERLVWDSRELKPGAIYCLSLLRPGLYNVHLSDRKLVGQVTVKPSTVDAYPYRPRETLLEVSMDELIPSDVEITPTDLLRFQFTNSSAVSITLKEPASKGAPRKVNQ